MAPDSDSEDEHLMLLSFNLLLRRRRRRQKRSRFWVHEILQLREELGEFHRLVCELSSHKDKFFQSFRMSEAQFTETGNHVDMLCCTGRLAVHQVFYHILEKVNKYLDYYRAFDCVTR